MSEKFQKISVVIITKNAERLLEKVLQSAKDIADEIIIVDSGSTDKTLEIADKFGVHIIKQKWLGYGKQKNLGMEKAKNNWVLSLDSDEIISPELKKSIQNADYEKYNGFCFAIKTYLGKKWIKHCGCYPSWHLRLFRKDKMKFSDHEVHEYVNIVEPIGYFKGDILHYSYTSYANYYEKIKIYSKLNGQFLYRQKKPWSLSYQIGRSIKGFFEVYIFKMGFLDGMLGFVVALFTAIDRYKAAKYLKYCYEIEKEGK